MCLLYGIITYIRRFTTTRTGLLNLYSKQRQSNRFSENVKINNNNKNNEKLFKKKAEIKHSVVHRTNKTHLLPHI